ncbi:MAG: SGNH/GDSL hydrolase family protein [Bacteroidales bacterium]|nr:SGNH/GDSL hydrolase family protein [Bacteroidales bacterium]
MIITLQNGKTVKINSIHKIVFYGFLFICCCLPFELFLRMNAKREMNHYAIYDAHPFLQNQLNKYDKGSHINSFGFRGDEIKKEKSQDVFRIFVIGGSTVFGWGVSFEKSHVRILERLLKQCYPDRKIEVLNAGASWHSSQHSVIKYLFKIKDFQPDLIILWHGINDLYRSFASEKFTVGDFQSDYSHFWGPMASMVLQHFDRKGTLEPLINIKLYMIDFFNVILYSDLRVFDNIPELESIDVYDFPSLGAFTRNMKAFVEIMKNDDVKLVLATQPFLYREGLDEEELKSLWLSKMNCAVNKAYPNVRSMERGMNLFNAATKMVAEQHQVPLIDLEMKVPKTKQYFLDDCHYTAEGNALVAQTVFEFLIEYHLLDSEP